MVAVIVTVLGVLCVPSAFMPSSPLILTASYVEGMVVISMCRGGNQGTETLSSLLKSPTLETAELESQCT